MSHIQSTTRTPVFEYHPPLCSAWDPTTPEGQPEVELTLSALSSSPPSSGVSSMTLASPQTPTAMGVSSPGPRPSSHTTGSVCTTE
eukprot:573763-Pyramimonas_sp.AAC.1